MGTTTTVLRARPYLLISFLVLMAQLPVAAGRVVKSYSAQSKLVRDWFQASGSPVHLIATRVQIPPGYLSGLFVDELHAWLRTDALLRTADGGRTWASLQPSRN